MGRAHNWDEPEISQKVAGTWRVVSKDSLTYSGPRSEAEWIAESKKTNPTWRRVEKDDGKRDNPTCSAGFGRRLAHSVPDNKLIHERELTIAEMIKNNIETITFEELGKMFLSASNRGGLSLEKTHALLGEMYQIPCYHDGNYNAWKADFLSDCATYHKDIAFDATDIDAFYTLYQLYLENVELEIASVDSVLKFAKGAKYTHTPYNINGMNITLQELLCHRILGDRNNLLEFVHRRTGDFLPILDKEIKKQKSTPAPATTDFDRKGKGKKVDPVMTDEEFARQLSQEMNGFTPMFSTTATHREPTRGPVIVHFNATTSRLENKYVVGNEFNVKINKNLRSGHVRIMDGKEIMRIPYSNASGANIRDVAKNFNTKTPKKLGIEVYETDSSSRKNKLVAVGLVDYEKPSHTRTSRPL